MGEVEKQQRSQRLQVRVPCHLRIDGRETRGFSSNLSATGLYVCVPREALGNRTLAAGDLVPLRFRLPHQTEDLEVGTEVVWVVPDDSSACAEPAVGVGMRLRACSEQTSRHLEAFVRDFRHTVMVLSSGSDALLPVQQALAADYHVVTYATADEALSKLATETVAVLLTDQHTLDVDTRGPFRRLVRRLPDAQIVELFVGEQPHADDQCEFIALGRLVHHVGVPVDADELKKVMARAVGIYAMQMENELLRIELARANDRLRQENDYLRALVPGRHGFENILGHSAALQQAFVQLERVRLTDVTIHIAGETGTGKELVARALHANGPRTQGPFVAQNCAGLTETLLQSTLFGHQRGAFTGADRDRPGVFQQASGGTLFLDEVAELSPATQGVLLRALEFGEITPVGAAEPVRVDVRVISATHRDLWQMVREGSFRADLQFRLMVVTVELPPLRERHGDIPLLAQHFLARHGQHYRKEVRGFAPETLQLLERYAWPGNVRELENEIERLVVLADGTDSIRPHLLSPHLLKSLGVVTPAAQGEAATGAQGASEDLARRVLDSDEGLDEVLGQLERAILVEALQRAEGNRSRAAQQLHLPRQTLQSRLRRFGL